MNRYKPSLYLVNVVLTMFVLPVISILLERRSDILGTGIDMLDWLFSRNLMRFATRGVMHWGNAHASVIWGPLRFETGIKTDRHW